MNTHAITQTASKSHNLAGWLTALAAVLLGCGAFVVLVQAPEALPLAALMAAFAIITRVGYNMTRTRVEGARVSTEEAAERTVGSLGLVIASVAIAPLIAFALLWTSLLLIIGGAWLLHVLGIA